MDDLDDLDEMVNARTGWVRRPKVGRLSLAFGLLLFVVGSAAVVDGYWDVEVMQVIGVGLVVSAIAFLGAIRLNQA